MRTFLGVKLATAYVFQVRLKPANVPRWFGFWCSSYWW